MTGRFLIAVFIISAAAAAFSWLPARASMDAPLASYYRYAHNDAEYSVTLPEAPKVETIWADEGDIPFLDNPPTDGALGEVATFKRVDTETEDVFDVKITFLKADRNFLMTMTKEKMQKSLQKEYEGTPLQEAKFTYSPGSPPLAWGVMTGFSIGQNNHAQFHALHYLTGEKTILVINASYDVENKKFQEYYKELIGGISYHRL